MRHDVVRPEVRDVVVRARRLPARVEAELVDLLDRERVDYTLTVTSGDGAPC